MKTYLHLKNEHKRILPEEFRNDDVRCTETLVEYFIEHFTKENDVVFDPFAGYGTTLLVADSMNRKGIGIEFDEKKYRYIQSLLKDPSQILHGDALKLSSYSLPAIDFSITSPPYTGKYHTVNPFTAYSAEGTYEQYLSDIINIYRLLAEKLKKGAHAVIEVSNLKHENGTITTLAWDIGQAVSQVLSFTGEIIVTWEPTYAYGYDHSYCLVFKK